MNRRIRGFTIFEMVIVLIMVGILTAGVAPLLLRQHTNAQDDKDRLALEDAKTAIVNYAISYGGIPDPLPVAAATGALVSPFTYPTTVAATSVVGLMPPSDTNTYAVPAFGVNNWGIHGGNSASNYHFRLDTNDALKSSYIKCITVGACTGTYATDAAAYAAYLATNSASGLAHQGGDRVVFCQAVNVQMAAAASPLICQNYNTRTVSGTTTVCTSTAPTAFVLFSAGANRTADQENDDRTLATALKTNRIYENDSRGINTSPGDDHYDDLVKSYPLSALARDCREKMGVTAEAMSCAPGQKYVGSVTNNYTSAVSYTLNGTTVSIPANSFTTYVNTCRARTVTMVVGTQTTALSAADTNGDGRVDFVITGTNTFTYQ